MPDEHTALNIATLLPSKMSASNVKHVAEDAAINIKSAAQEAASTIKDVAEDTTKSVNKAASEASQPPASESTERIDSLVSVCPFVKTSQNIQWLEKVNHCFEKISGFNYLQGVW